MDSRGKKQQSFSVIGFFSTNQKSKITKNSAEYDDDDDRGADDIEAVHIDESLLGHP